MEHEKSSPSGCSLAALILVGLLATGIVFLSVFRPGCGPLSNMPRTISGQIVDETGQAVADAEITLNWSVGIGLNPTKGPSENHVVDLRSDSTGHFSGKGRSGYTGFSAKKEGYYPSSLSIGNEGLSEGLQILLNKVRQPQPMVGKRAKIIIPVGSSRLEYDLLAGDALPPHGNGTVADLIFEWRQPDIDKGEYPRDVISVSIPGDGNGAITRRLKHGRVYSTLRSLHQAPESGYAPTFAKADQNAGGFTGEFYGAERIYYLRIRSDTGKPLYGKMQEGVRFIPGPLSSEDEFEFEYVINPSGDRGLEMDIKKITVPERHRLEYEPKFF